MNGIFDKRDLAVSGQGGWDCYRIPGIIATPKGTVLAYYEARTSAGDYTAANICLRRSTDSGSSWEAPRLLTENPDEDTINNPVMIARKNGEIHFLWQRNYENVFHKVSFDDGITWTKATDITKYMYEFRKLYDWTVIAMGPGHGIELSGGRLVVPIWMSSGGGRAHSPSVTSTIASDDGGRTWSCGQIIPSTKDIVNPNEATVAELSGGRVMINIRNVSDVKRRAVSVSDDGVGPWSAPRLDAMLPDPVCFGSLLKQPGSHSLLFANCDTDGVFEKSAGDRTRKNLTLKVSRDEGATWARAAMIERNSGYADFGCQP